MQGLFTLTTLALGSEAESKIAGGLVQADALAASARLIEPVAEGTRVYEAGVKAFGHTSPPFPS